MRATLLVVLTAASLQAAPPPSPLPKGQSLFFVEDNLVYSRYLLLSPDGTYRQINQERHDAGTEADQGTWTQAADGTVALHFTYGGLRPRALRRGPLTILLDSVSKLDALPRLGEAIRQLLAGSQASIFPAAAGELRAAPAAVAVDREAEAFSRADLEALAAQVDRAAAMERTRTCSLQALRAPGGSPLLLVLPDATYGPAQLPQVCRDYRVLPGSPPPFYFARIDAGAFARRVGRWQERQPVGGWRSP